MLNLHVSMSKPLLRSTAEGLLVIGTALTVYWQPLARQVPAKPSDVVFVLTAGAWLLSLFCANRRGPLVPVNLRLMLAPLALLASLLVATLIGYLRYDLTMGRDGTILLARLALCVALFVATCHLTHDNARLQGRLSLALLAPVVLFPLMLVPALSASMWDQGRFQGLTVNPNTADLGLCIALAMTCALAIYEAGAHHRLPAGAFALVASGMLVLMIWTQSRAYLAGALASVVTAAVLMTSRARLPGLRAAVAAALACLVVGAAGVLVAPRAFVSSYLERLSEVTLARPDARTPTDGSRAQPHPFFPIAPAAARTPALSNWILVRGRPSFVPGQYGALTGLENIHAGAVRRLLENPHIQAALLYAALVPGNPVGLGVNYEEKFFVYFPWINERHHGTNSLLDIPIYGGAGAVLSVVYLMWLIASRTRESRKRQRDGVLPYRIGATAAFVGLWVAAVLLGSPIFDYQFWIVTALALADPQPGPTFGTKEPPGVARS